MSNDLDWKKLISTVAPTIGVMMGGPLAGTAVSALSNLFLGKSDGTESELSDAIQSGLTPEKIAELQKLDIDHKEFMAKLGFDYAKLNQESELAYVEDTKDARKYKDPSVFAMGIAILVAFSITMILALIGAYQILSGGIIIKDISVVAGIAGFVGTVIGYVASSAQQVIGYFFGSSAGSVQKTSAMAESFKSAMDSSKK